MRGNTGVTLVSRKRRNAPTMRYSLLPFVALALAAACSRPTQPSPTPTPAPPSAPAPTADTLAAKAVAQDYFDRLKARDWRGAHALWVPGAAGPLPAFTAALSKPTSFTGSAGAPSEVRTTDGVDYVLIEAATDTTDAAHMKTARSGVVMLKRPTGGAAPWRIWGTDIRPRHCKAGEQARGAGCVKG